MTGLDIAFRKGFEGAGQSSYTPFVEPVKAKWWQNLLYYVGKPEEWLTKTVANTFSNNPKYDWDRPSYYGNQLNWIELLRDAGVDKPADPLAGESFPLFSTMLGLGLSVVTDPISYVTAGGLTKAGVVGERLSRAGKAGVSLADKVSEGGTTVKVLDNAKQIEELTRLKSMLSASKNPAEKATLESGIASLEKHTGEINDINTLLERYQLQGMSIDDLKLAPTKWEQAQKGQRKFLGLQNPFAGSAFAPLGFGTSPLAQAAMSLNNEVANSIHSLAYRISGGVLDTVGDTASRVFSTLADKLSGGAFPAVKTARMRELGEELRAIAGRENLDAMMIKEQAQKLYDDFKDLSPEEKLSVTERIEAPITKQMGNSAGKAFMDLLHKAHSDTPIDPTQYALGKEVALNPQLVGTVPGSRLVTGGKLAYFERTRLDPNDVTEAVDQYATATAPKLRVGAHEALLTDKYLVVQPHTVSAVDYKVDSLRDVAGVAQYEKTELQDGSVVLVARRHPGMHRVETTQGTTGVKWNPEHTRNLEVTAAALAAKGKSLVDLQPADILANPEGLISIINPDKIADAKKGSGLSVIGAAREVSKTSIRNFLEKVDQPSNAMQDFFLLANDKNARSAYRLQSQFMRVRTANTDVKDGVMLANDVLDMAANAEIHREYVRNRMINSNSAAVPRITGTPDDFARANNIEAWRQNIRQQLETTGEVRLPAIELGKHPDGWAYVRDGRDRMTAAVLEGIDVIPVKKVDYTGEAIDFGIYDIHNPKNVTEAAMSQGDAATTGLKIEFNASRDPSKKEVKLTIKPEDALKIVGKPIKLNPQQIAEAGDMLKDGKAVSPVVIKVDVATGKVLSADNIHSLVAAQKAGVKDLPVYVSFANKGKFTKTLSEDETYRLLNVAQSSGNSVSDALSGEYKLLSATGERMMLEPTSLSPATGSNVMRKFMEMTRITPKGLIDRNGELFIEALVKRAGSFEAAAVQLSEFMEQSRNLGITEFAKALREFTGMSPNAFTGTNVRTLFEQLKTDVINAATTHLDELARNGVFTANTIQDAKRLRMFNLNSRTKDGRIISGGVVESYANGLPTFASGSKTVDELSVIAKQTIHGYTDLEGVMPFQKVRFIGADGEKIVEIRDLVGQHSKLVDLIPRPNVMKITDEFKAELKSKGIFFNPTKEELAEVLDPVTGRLLKVDEKAAEAGNWSVRRPEVGFFFTPSGQLFVGTKGQSSAEIMQAVYKEGPMFVSEWGVATKDGIFLNSPFGAAIRKAGVPELRVMEKRVKEVAKSFEKMGFDKTTKLDITAPFEPSVWEKMYSPGTTIEKVLQKSWKLDLPDEIRNMPLDVFVDAPHSVIAVSRPRLQNPKLQNIMEFYADVTDTLYAKEARAGLPVQYNEAYFARFVTKEGRQALAELNKRFEKLILNNSEIKNKESFIKNRVLTDYTTLEFNNLVNKIRELKVSGLSGDDIYSRVIDMVKSDKDFVTISDLADEMNKISKDFTIGFFHQDPLLSVAYRARDSAIARNRKAIVDTMVSQGAAISMPVGDVAKLKTARSTIESTDKELSSLVVQLREAEADLQNLATSPDLAKLSGRDQILLDRVNKLKAQRGELELKKADLEQLLRRNSGILATDINIKGTSAYVEGDTVQRLLERGLITEDSIRQQAGNSLIEVPLAKYTDLLDKEGARVVFFTDEARPLALKYFDSMDRSTGFAKILRDRWDQLTDMWRRWTLFTAPSYHIRNIFSNFYMATLGGLQDVEAYRNSFHLTTLMRRFKKGEISWGEMTDIMDKTVFSNSFGQTSTLREQWAAFHRAGGVTGGLTFNEFNKFTGGVSQSDEFISKAVESKLTPSSEMATNWLYDNKLLRKSRSFGAHIETFFRFAVFNDAWKRLGSFEEAALHMKAVLYDYSNMSLFERNVLRRVFPFYSWSRQNIPQMVRTMFTQPVTHYRFAQWVNGWERGALDGKLADSDTELPEWIRRGVVMGKDSKGNWLIKMPDGFIPVYDVFKMFSDPSQMLQEGLTPVLKIPIEQFSNRSLYTGADLEKYPGEPAQSWTLKNLGFTKRSTKEGPLGYFNYIANESVFASLFRPAKLLSKFLDGVLDSKSDSTFSERMIPAMIDLAVGRSYAINPVEARAQVYSNWAATRTKFINLANRAEASGDEVSANQLRKLLLDMEFRKPVK